ncbi:tetratricopeptide repeat protein [bacterium]|nr:tetratricopeptide repeat protein [candidate division CSSED10-310 bacterium]
MQAILKADRFIVLIVSLLLVAGIPGCAHRKEAHDRAIRAEIAYNTGVAYLNRGELIEALDSLLTALELEPENSGVHNAIGLVYSGQGKHQAAVDEFVAAMKIDDYPEYHNNLAQAYLMLNRPGDALEECDRALADQAYRTPGYAYFNKAMALIKLDREPEAMEQLQTAVRRDPNADRPLYELAVLQMKYNHLEEAIGNLQLALKNNPSYHAAAHQLAVAYVQAGKPDLACAQLNNIITKTAEGNPAHAKARALAMQLCEGR